MSKKKKKLIFLVLCVALVGGAVLFATSQGSSQKKEILGAATKINAAQSAFNQNVNSALTTYKAKDKRAGTAQQKAAAAQDFSKDVVKAQSNYRENLTAVKATYQPTVKSYNNVIQSAQSNLNQSVYAAQSTLDATLKTATTAQQRATASQAFALAVKQAQANYLASAAKATQEFQQTVSQLK